MPRPEDKCAIRNSGKPNKGLLRLNGEGLQIAPLSMSMARDRQIGGAAPAICNHRWAQPSLVGGVVVLPYFVPIDHIPNGLKVIGASILVF